MKNDYMTAEQARHFSTKKLIDDFPEESHRELISKIELAAKSGQTKIVFTGKVNQVTTFDPCIKNGYKEFLELLGYKVILGQYLTDINCQPTITQFLEISW